MVPYELPMTPDAFQALFGDLPWTAAQGLLTPGALLLILVVGLSIGLLALAVASMSGADEAQGTAVRRTSSTALATWFSDSCAWVCPWHPKQPLAGRS